MTQFLPSEFYLAQNYPNPFREKTVIKYCVAYKTRVKLTVYNCKGELVKTLVDQEEKPGAYEVEFQSTLGNWQLATGNYVCCFKAGNYSSQKEMIISK